MHVLPGSAKKVWHEKEYCESANDEADADVIVNRAKWVPSFDWLAKNLEWDATDLSQTIKVLDYWSNHAYEVSPSWMHKRYPKLNATIPLVHNVRDHVVDFCAMVNVEADMMSQKHRLSLLKDAPAMEERATQLYSLGPHYLYGMLYEELIPLRKASLISPSGVREAKEHNGNVTLSVALHSRHRKEEHDGRDILQEQRCLSDLLSKRAPGQECQICLMSDRPTTIQGLTIWLQQHHNCSVVTYNHTANEHSYRKEHGPHAGIGFLRELDQCRRYGTDGLVLTGWGSSSSALLQEMVTYKIESVKNRIQLIPSTLLCAG